MCSSMLLLGIVALLIANVRIGASLQKESTRARRCYQCDHQDNSTSTETLCARNDSMRFMLCPLEKPYCAITALSPNFASTFYCTEAIEDSCSLIYSPVEITHRITCVCINDLCNEPISKELRQKLQNYSTNTIADNTTKNQIDETDLFIQTQLNSNNSRNELLNLIIHKDVGLKLGDSFVSRNYSTNSTSAATAADDTVLKDIASLTKDEEGPNESPRADALKQEVRSPSDDEEDEAEGSGSWGEEAAGRPQRRPGPAAAAPGAVLPARAHDNKASCLFINLVVATLYILYVIV